MKPRTALFLTNTASRAGAKLDIEKCCLRFQEAGLLISVEDRPNWDPDSEATAERFAKFDLIVIAGGDGSINRFLKPLIKSQSLLAVVPTGTANDFARGLMLPFNSQEAISEILRGKEIRVDTATVNGKPFMNVAHIGLGTKITDKLSPSLKKRWGALSYIKACTSALRRMRRYNVGLTADDDTYKLHPCHMSVGNGRYYGGGNIVDQECHADDGELSVVALRRRSIGQFMMIAPFIRTGTHSILNKGFKVKAKKITITVDKTLEIHADGEVLTTTPATFEVLPASLRVVAHRDWQGVNEQSSIWSSVMNWLKSDDEVYVSEVLNLAQESSQQFSDAAELARSEELKSHLLKYAQFRRRLGERIVQFERDQGELPSMNDPDSEWLSEVVNYFLVKVSVDEDQSNIERRIAAEKAIEQRLNMIIEHGYSHDFEPYIMTFKKNNARVISELKALQ